MIHSDAELFLICFVLCKIPHLHSPIYLVMPPQSAPLILLVMEKDRRSTAQRSNMPH